MQKYVVRRQSHTLGNGKRRDPHLPASTFLAKQGGELGCSLGGWRWSKVEKARPGLAWEDSRACYKMRSPKVSRACSQPACVV